MCLDEMQATVLGCVEEPAAGWGRDEAAELNAVWISESWVRREDTYSSFALFLPDL
jgi:hypothetical protein